MEDKDKSKETPSLAENQGIIEFTASSGRTSIRQASNKVKLMLTLFSVFAYVASFLLIYYMRDYGMGVVAIIPVIVVGWLYGCVAGICTAILTFFTNILMFEYLGVDWIDRIILKGIGISAAVAYMFIGAAVGRLSDLSIQVVKELSHRKQAEDSLKKAHAELELRVTERTDELRKVKDHLDNIIESSLDCIIVSDEKGCITRVNKSFMKLTGYEKEDVVGNATMEISITKEGTYEATTGEMVEIGDEHFKNARQMVEKLFKEGEITDWESYFFRKDKKIVPVEVNMALLYNEKGEVIGSIGVNRDITERKKNEASFIKIKAALDSSNDAIGMTDANMKILYLNKSFLDMFGYPIEEIEKMGIPEVYRDADFVKKVMQGLTDGKTWEGEVQIRSRDGKDPVCFLSTSPIFDDKGVIIGYFGRHTDITARKEIEHKLLQSEKLKSLGELAGGVAHDFNNVLAAILGNAQLLKMSMENPQGIEERRKTIHELKQGLDVIEKAAKDGAETVRRIQEFARTRDEDKYFTAVNINEVIADALNFTKMRWKDDAESKEIKINIQKELSTLPTTAGSGAELREVMVNLINNAIDAMPEGGDIKIKTFLEDGQVCIRVQDTGGGIPSDRKDRIFDPFFTTKGVQSSGLGLSVSYGIINRHRGTIVVDSVEGEGTTFTIKLPLSDGVVEAEQGKLIEVEHRKAKILVIEDEEQVRNLLSAILTKGGHEVETATGGSQGIEMFEKNEFDLVFTDLGMPGISGWQVAEKIKSINEKAPVALITGWNIELKEFELEKSGVDLIVQKPFEVNQVLRLVQEGMMLRDKFKTD
jgi:PAS domain S-box-containing protein